MSNKIVFICDGTMDGIFTAIYEGFEERNARYGNGGIYYRDNIEICVEENYTRELFCEYIQVDTDNEKAYKTAMSIRKKMGSYVYSAVIDALCHYDSRRATDVFGFLVRGFKMGPKVIEMLSDKYVMRVMELSRKSSRESHLFKGFLRFKDLSGTLYSVIAPKCNVVPLVAGHFQDRYPAEDWIIYDKKRNIAAIHKKHEMWIMSEDIIDGEKIEKLYEEEDSYTDLFKVFYDSLNIKERKNERCQRNLLPLWYRENMSEFGHGKNEQVSSDVAGTIKYT